MSEATRCDDCCIHAMSTKWEAEEKCLFLFQLGNVHTLFQGVTHSAYLVLEVDNRPKLPIL